MLSIIHTYIHTRVAAPSKGEYSIKGGRYTSTHRRVRPPNAGPTRDTGIPTPEPTHPARTHTYTPNSWFRYSKSTGWSWEGLGKWPSVRVRLLRADLFAKVITRGLDAVSFGRRIREDPSLRIRGEF